MSARSLPKRWTVGLLVVVACLVVGGLVASRFGGGPRYQGHGMRYWFPIWGMSSEEWYETRFSKLVEAGPELLPLLLAAANELDSPEQMHLEGLTTRLPDSEQGWLPSRIDASRRLEMVRRVSERWVVSNETNARAFTNSFDAFPDDLRLEAIRMLSYQPGKDAILIPHWLRLLDQPPNEHVAFAASLGLLMRSRAGNVDGYGNIPERVIQVLQDLPPSAWQGRGQFGLSQLIFALAPQTSRLGSAEPWLRGWLNTGAPPFRASAVLLLPFIAPDRYPVAKTVDDAWPRLGSVGVALLMHARLGWFDRPEQQPVRRAFVETLAPRLLSNQLDEWETRWRQSPDPALRDPNGMGMARLAERRMHWVGQLGQDALAAAPFLPAFFGEKPADAFRAVQALGRIGPSAPETIPSLLPGLTNEVTAAPLVLLLAAYGPKAGAAIPALARLAADDALFAPQPSLDGLPSQEATRLGLPAPTTIRALRHGAGVSAAKLNFAPELAAETGLANVWPDPVGATNRISLADLAAAAIRRIQAPAR